MRCVSLHISPAGRLMDGAESRVSSASCAADTPSYKTDKHCCLMPGNKRARKRCCTGWREGKERETGSETEHK
ncbi:hypothetical protein CgunFtcFv8_016722 [Champsocephalus gunnari]|uniref:Uncharacterized protein n=1 Tax=Champsocephalus gunnari TaxID=52237 RepID=A0AAN8HAF0_CHAGU|nr:hypothetical protein CgunFtcFv8_016722 [Champsocephalus gunnari]